MGLSRIRPRSARDASPPSTKGRAAPVPNGETASEEPPRLQAVPVLPEPSPDEQPAAATRVMAKVIAFANQKGGVAKTTTTLNLGVALRELGHRVLLVDLDPQGNLTMSQGMNPDAIERSMFDVLVHRVPISDVVQRVEVDGGVLFNDV